MKILITGGTGFIGRALTRSLLEQSYEVSVLSRNPDSIAKHCGSGVNALGNLQQIRRMIPMTSLLILPGPLFLALVGRKPVKK
jgi:uncharacterized protein YbjT (DUF2867 family)